VVVAKLYWIFPVSIWVPFHHIVLNGGKSMISAFGIAVCLAALIVIGLSANARGQRRPWVLQIGLATMFAGVMVAAFATEAVESLGWLHP
jgi:hypothetical protein